MKKSLKLSCLLLCAVLVSSLNSFGQSDDMDKADMVKMAKKPFKERISVTGSIGWLHAWGDFKTDGFFPSFLQSDANELGYGVLFNYELSNVFSISTGAVIGQLEGRLDNIATVNAINNSTDFGKGIEFRTDLFEITLPRINANITRAIFKDRSPFFNKVSVGLFLSQGLVFYDSQIFAQDPEGTDVNLVYSDVRGASENTSSLVTAFGGNIMYRLNDKFDIGVESSIRVAYTDDLDAWEAGDFDDGYSYTGVSLTYHFGRKSKNGSTTKESLLAEKEAMKKEAMKEVEEAPKKEEMMKEEVVEKKEEMVDKMEDKMEEKKEEAVEKKEEMIDKMEDKVEDKMEEKKEEVIKKEEPKVTQKEEKPVITGYRYYVVVAAFKGQTSTDLLMTRLKKKGEEPVVIRNLEDTWNLVTIAEYDNKPTALKEMKKARGKGFDKAWVHILPPVK